MKNKKVTIPVNSAYIQNTAQEYTKVWQLIKRSKGSGKSGKGD